jgi:hydroxymethylpyrimidine pyrophosphatase-like HAD family hydrolase
MKSSGINKMLQSAYHSYAMANAPKEVKKHARFIAESNRNNGVIKTIKELIYK